MLVGTARELIGGERGRGDAPPARRSFGGVHAKADERLGADGRGQILPRSVSSSASEQPTIPSPMITTPGLRRLAGPSDDASRLRVKPPQVSIARDAERRVPSSALAGLCTNLTDCGSGHSDAAGQAQDHDRDDDNASHWLRKQRAKRKEREHKNSGDHPPKLLTQPVIRCGSGKKRRRLRGDER
jgi:hypothetical protein